VEHRGKREKRKGGKGEGMDWGLTRAFCLAYWLACITPQRRKKKKRAGEEKKRAYDRYLVEFLLIGSQRDFSSGLPHYSKKKKGGKRGEGE